MDGLPLSVTGELKGLITSHFTGPSLPLPQDLRGNSPSLSRVWRTNPGFCSGWAHEEPAGRRENKPECENVLLNGALACSTRDRHPSAYSIHFYIFCWGTACVIRDIYINTF